MMMMMLVLSHLPRDADGPADDPTQGEGHGSMGQAAPAGPEASVLRLPLDHAASLPGVPSPGYVSLSFPLPIMFPIPSFSLVCFPFLRSP